MVRKATMPAGEFKAKCLAVLDEVASSGRPVVVTKRGKPVAQVVPIPDEHVHADLHGSIVAETDVVAPIGERWSADE